MCCVHYQPAVLIRSGSRRASSQLSAIVQWQYTSWPCALLLLSHDPFLVQEQGTEVYVVKCIWLQHQSGKRETFLLLKSPIAIIPSHMILFNYQSLLFWGRQYSNYYWTRTVQLLFVHWAARISGNKWFCRILQLFLFTKFWILDMRSGIGRDPPRLRSSVFSSLSCWNPLTNTQYCPERKKFAS